jgi:hypothetical protein
MTLWLIHRTVNRFVVIFNNWLARSLQTLYSFIIILSRLRYGGCTQFRYIQK